MVQKEGTDNRLPYGSTGIRFAVQQKDDLMRLTDLDNKILIDLTSVGQPAGRG